MRFLLVALVLGVVVASAAAVFFLQLPREEPAPPIGVERPIPEDVVLPAQIPRVVQVTYILHREELSPAGVTRIIGGQTMRLQLSALDFGTGEGWLFEIPGLEVSETVLPGQTVRLELTPRTYNNFVVRATSGDITHTAVLRVAPPDQ